MVSFDTAPPPKKDITNFIDPAAGNGLTRCPQTSNSTCPPTAEPGTKNVKKEAEHGR